MARLYRVHEDPSVPRLGLPDPSPYGIDFPIFDGRSKGVRSPGIFEFELSLESSTDYHRQFYGFVPGVLALPNEAWEECDEIYYGHLYGSEVLFARAGGRHFSLINPRDAVPPDPTGSMPCRIDQWPGPLCRIAGRNPLDLCCAAEMTGIVAPDDEFKFVYDKFGCRGLIFEEVWNGEVVGPVE